MTMKMERNRQEEKENKRDLDEVQSFRESDWQEKGFGLVVKWKYLCREEMSVKKLYYGIWFTFSWALYCVLMWGCRDFRPPVFISLICWTLGDGGQLQFFVKLNINENPRDWMKNYKRNLEQHQCNLKIGNEMFGKQRFSDYSKACLMAERTRQVSKVAVP